MFTLILIPVPLTAQRAGGWLPFGDVATPQPPTLALHTATDTRIDLVASLPGVETETLAAEGHTYTRLFGDGYGFSTELGLPNVPVLRQRIEIPFGAEVSLEILSADYEDVALADLGLHPIYPTQPQVVKLPGVEVPFVIDDAFYANGYGAVTGSRYPASPVTLGEIYVVRGHRVQPIDIAAVAYDPGRGTLRLYKSFAIRLRLTGSDSPLTQAQAARYASAFDATLGAQILNYNQGRPLPAAPATGEGYLIIVADAYQSALAPFVSLKQNQGFDVTVTPLSAIPNGSTNTGIKAYIQDAYDTWSTPPAYLLLVGDTNTIPAWTGQDANEATDLYYVTMDGASDWHPDIGRGRFPVRSAAQTTYIVDKYLAYAALTGENWLDWASFIATCDSGNYTIAEGTHNYVIDTYTAPEGYVGTFPNNPQPGGDKLYCITYNATHSDVVNAMNEGRVMTIYSGHGSHSGWAAGSYYSSDVQAMTSYDIYPFVASHACVTNDFEETEVFGETWILQENKGALVFWGSSDNSMWGPDDSLERAMFDALFLEGAPQPTVAAMTDYGLAETEIAYPSNARYYWETYNVLGDPALKVYLEPEIPTFTMDVEPTDLAVCNANEANAAATVSINSILSYSSTVTLLAGALPADVSAAFTPATAPAPFTSTLDLTTGTSAPQGDHTFVITATDYAANTQARDVNLRIVNSTAPTGTLLTPANGVLGLSLTPDFTWDAVPLADGYTIQVDTGPHFAAPVIDAQTPVAAYTPATPLNGGTCYWWRAQSANACGDSPWAVPFHFATVAVDVAFQDTMESGDGQWSHAATTGTDGWTISTDQAHSPTHAWHVPDAAVLTDSVLWMAAPVLVGNGSTLSFWHRHEFEGSTTYYDGGVLEISTDGGATWNDMGAHITANGYNGTLSSNNALGARLAWVADLTDWTEVTADLSAFAGQNVQLRWRLGCDGSVGDTGWFIDDVQITAPQAPNPAPILDAIAPNAASPFVDAPVQLTGSHFTGAPNVLIDGPGLDATWLLSVTLVNSSTLDAVVPAGLAWGTYTVTLYNGDCQQAALLNALTLVGTCDISPTVTLAGPGATELDAAPAFTAVATGTQPLTYAWDFGGSGSGTALNTATPEFYYAAPGTYTVTVTVTDPCGASDVATTTVEIYCNAPTVGVAVDASIVEIGAAQHFTATTTGTGPLTYAWNFGGAGSGGSLDTATPTFTYAAPGAYTAAVTVTGPCGVATDTVAVEITCDAPTVSAAVDAASVDLGTAQHFTATTSGTGPLAYAWDFGGAGSGSGTNTATPSFTYRYAGTYTATVTVTGPCGIVSDTVAVEITCEPAEVSLSAGATTVELGDAIHFTGSITSPRSVSFAWDFGGAGTGENLYSLHPSFTYAAPGTYTVTLTATDLCGIVRATLVVEVVCDPPQVTLSGPHTVEMGAPAQFEAAVTNGTGPFSFAWDFGGAGTGSDLDTATPTFAYAAPGAYTPTVTVSNAVSSTQASISVTVMCYAPQATLDAIAPVAFGHVVRPVAHVISGTAPFTYTWDFGGAGSGTGLDTATPTFTYDEPGAYTVTFTAANVEDAVSVQGEALVYQRLTGVTVDGEHLAPVGEVRTFTASALPLTATAPISYVWDNGSIGASAVYSWTMAGEHTVAVTATHAYGAASTTYTVTAFDAVRILSLTSDSPVDAGAALHATAVITGAGPYTLTWDFGGAGAGTGLDTPTPTYTYAQAGAYTLTLTATHAYPSMDVRQVAVLVRQKYTIYLPFVLR